MGRVAHPRGLAVTPPRRWSLATAVAVGCLLAGTGCSHDSTPSSRSPDSTNTTPTGAGATGSGSAPRLHATLLQYRTDEGTNRLEVELTNRSGGPVTVRSVQLTWSGVHAAPRTPKDTTYVPGQIIDLTTTYGVASCGGAAPTDPPRARVTLAGGEELDLTLDRHGASMMRQFRTRDCGLARLKAIASISISRAFRDVRTAAGEHLSGTLFIRRSDIEPSTSQDGVTITDTTGSVLLTFTPDEHLPATLGPGDPLLRLPISIGVGPRCDAHGLSQSTQTYLFSAYAKINDRGPQQRVILIPDDSVKAQAQAMLERACQ